MKAQGALHKRHETVLGPIASIESGHVLMRQVNQCETRFLLQYHALSRITTRRKENPDCSGSLLFRPSVAQWIEQVHSRPMVPGSNPGGGTQFFLIPRIGRLSSFFTFVSIPTLIVCKKSLIAYNLVSYCGS